MVFNRDIWALQICYNIDEITEETDLSQTTRDFNCNWMLPLTSSTTSWQDINANQYERRFYKIKTICSVLGFNPINLSNETVGKYEVPLYRVDINGQNINDRFSIPLLPKNNDTHVVLKSLGKGRGKGNDDFSYATCNEEDFVGNYTNVWEWDIDRYFSSGRDSSAATLFYKSDALCPYYLSDVYDLKNISTGRYYEVYMSENDTLVNVGKVIMKFIDQLYSDVEPFEIRRSPFGSTLTYNKTVEDGLSDIGNGRGTDNDHPDASQWDTCTGDSADDFVGFYTDVRSFDGKIGEWRIYVPDMFCGAYSQTDICTDDGCIEGEINVTPGEAYLVNMTEDKTLTFEHGE